MTTPLLPHSAQEAGRRPDQNSADEDARYTGSKSASDVQTRLTAHRIPLIPIPEGSSWVSGNCNQEQGEERAEKRVTALPNVVHGLEKADVERKKSL